MWNSYSDLLVLVLIRLPPKSLGRCMCVSKPWKVVISSTEFIRFHLQYQSSIQIKPKRLLSKDVLDDESEGQYETHLAEYSINNGRRDGENLELGFEIQQLYNPYEGHAPGMKIMLVGSCDGLLCQVLCRETKESSIYGEYEISLCNPLTKSTWVLPKSPFVLEDEAMSRRRRRRIAFFGFGYDDVHETYKVFIASGPPHDEYKGKCGLHKLPDARYEYQVYSLRSNKWIIVSSSDLEDLHDYFFHCPNWNLDGVLINCALHWILTNPFGPLRNKDREKNYILAFDLRVNKHNILPLPDDAQGCYCLFLTVLNGCLLLSDGGTKLYPEDTFDMWVMKDYGLKDSWTRIRIHTTPYDLCYTTPVALLEEEDNHHHHPKRKLIYHDCRVPNLLSYDVETHQVVEFPTPSATFHLAQHLQFVGSLVQPRPPSFG